MDGLGIAAKMVGLAVERDRLEHQLRRTEKMEALGLLAGGVAHDFNNLLSTILGNAELLQSKLSRDADLSEMAADILSAGRSAADLCRQILAYAGRGHASRELIHCNALLREVVSLVSLAKGRDTEFTLQFDGAELGVVGDASQVQSLLFNLLTNACDAIGVSEGRITVSTRVRRYTQRELQHLGFEPTPDAGEFVEIEVVDTGRGIAPENLARIFDPFFSTKSAKRGLGLAAAQGIAASHRGAITVCSEVDVGTTFLVLLPYVRIDVVQATDLGHPPIREGLQVLVADDDLAVREALARTLRHAGMDVILAADGQQAVAAFREHQNSIQCVLLDYSMPKMTGGEAMRQIRELAPAMPVLLATGYVERGVLAQLQSDGVAAVLQKPMPRSTLLAAIYAAVSR